MQWVDGKSDLKFKLNVVCKFMTKDDISAYIGQTIYNIHQGYEISYVFANLSTNRTYIYAFKLWNEF